MKKFYHWCVRLGLGLILNPIFAQNTVVQGSITDIYGEPLIGVNVLIKGTALGTVSDIDGEYRIKLDEGRSILSYSYIGYISQEILITDQTIIDVQLQEDISNLADVIVVGYTVKDRRKLTSAISTVDGERIKQVPMATFDNILQGTVPGLLVQSGTGQPGRTAGVQLRGIKSINQSSEPLYILDGIQITEYDFKAINPNDIASVSVLKDAAATQIYGSRGATGVIVITTKVGQKGKLKIEYNALYGVSVKPDYNEGLRPLTSEQHINLQHEIGLGPLLGLPQEVLDSMKNINTDWLDVTTQNGKTQSHDFSLSGGGDYTTFFISGSYFSQEGTSLRSKLDRYSLRTKVGYEKDNFSISTNLYLAHTETLDSENEGGFSNSNPFYSAIRSYPFDYAIDPRTGDYALPYSGGSSTTLNILEKLKTTEENYKIDKANIGINLGYKIPYVKGLRLAALWAVDYSADIEIDYIPANSFTGPTRQGGQGSRYESFGRRTRISATNSIHYDFDIANDHAFSVAAYQEYIQRDSRSTEIEVYGFDRINTIAGATQGADGNGFIPEFGGSTGKHVLTSFFATLDYSYKAKYDLTAGIRRDGSSSFGLNNQYGTFYSAGFGWTITEEAFMSPLRFVNYAKLRVSYGTVGNQSISATDARSIFDPEDAGYNGVSGLKANLANLDLQWEATAKVNLGLDLTLFENFLSINANWYDEVSSNLFLEEPLSYTTGFSVQNRNIGSLRNRGVELNVATNNIRTSNFEWNTSFNITSNRTTMVELPNGSFYEDYFLVEEGKEFGLFNLVERAGVNPATGVLMWYDAEGNLTETYSTSDAVDIAPSAPRYYGGFTNAFTFKGFDLSVFFTYAQGHSIFNVARTSLDNPTKISRGGVSTNALRFWRNPGDITDLPDPNTIAEYPNDSGWLEDASYVKLRNVILSYNFPTQWLNRWKLGGLRLYAQGQNLYTWTTFSGLDPENSDVEYVADYPALSTYTVGIDVKF